MIDAGDPLMILGIVGSGIGFQLGYLLIPMPIAYLSYLVLSRERVMNQNAMVVRPTDNGSINPLFCPKLIPDTKQEID